MEGLGSEFLHRKSHVRTQEGSGPVTYGASEAAPFQGKFKLTHNRRSTNRDWPQRNAKMNSVRHRSYATYSRQPRQVRKEATVTGSCVCSGPPVPGLIFLLRTFSPNLYNLFTTFCATKFF